MWTTSLSSDIFWYFFWCRRLLPYRMAVLNDVFVMDKNRNASVFSSHDESLARPLARSCRQGYSGVSNNYCTATGLRWNLIIHYFSDVQLAPELSNRLPTLASHRFEFSNPIFHFSLRLHCGMEEGKGSPIIPKAVTQLFKRLWLAKKMHLQMPFLQSWKRCQSNLQVSCYFRPQ